MSFIAVAQQLGSGMLASLSIFVLTLVFSLPLGLFVAFGRKSRIKPVQWLVKLYISIMRGTPLMLQLLVVYFGPYYLFGIRISKEYSFYATIIGFSINYAAYFAEIYRAGIEGIPVGQYEAAKVLGYSKAQTFCKIIFPRVVPPVTNEVITLVKDTSMAFVLAYAEMFTIAKQIAARVSSIMPLFVAGLFYYIFNFVVAFIMERIEKKLSYYK